MDENTEGWQKTVWLFACWCESLIWHFLHWHYKLGRIKVVIQETQRRLRFSSGPPIMQTGLFLWYNLSLSQKKSSYCCACFNTSSFVWVRKIPFFFKILYLKKPICMCFLLGQLYIHSSLDVTFQSVILWIICGQEKLYKNVLRLPPCICAPYKNKCALHK